MRFYYKILNLFEGSPLKIRFFTQDQTIPPNTFDLIITTDETVKGFPISQVLQLKSDELDSDIILRIFGIIARKLEPKFKEVVLGVDPGKRIGIAAVCDGMILAARTSNLKNLPMVINKYYVTFPSEKIIIRVGNQPLSISQVVFNKLFAIFGNSEDIVIEIVEEANSNPKKPFFRSISDSDEIAAITIAQRAGKILNHSLKTEIPAGRIAEIQKWSREHSQNRITIDTELAKSVALGKISLDEAIKQKEKELKVKMND